MATREVEAYVLTPNQLRQLMDDSVLGAFSMSDLVGIASVLVAIFAIGISTWTTLSVHCQQSKAAKAAERRAEEDERLKTTLELHAEYNSDEMARRRSEAIRFVQLNRAADWVDAELEPLSTSEASA